MVLVPGPNPLFVLIVIPHGGVPERPPIRNTFAVVPLAVLKRAPVLNSIEPSLMIARFPFTVYGLFVNVNMHVEAIRIKRLPPAHVFLM
jgi:hypothetical protein